MPARNPYVKRRPTQEPYEVWKNDKGWTWFVLKKFDLDDSAPDARWLCLVVTPFAHGGKLEEVLAQDVRAQARMTYQDRSVLLKKNPEDNMGLFSKSGMNPGRPPRRANRRVNSTSGFLMQALSYLGVAFEEASSVTGSEAILDAVAKLANVAHQLDAVEVMEYIDDMFPELKGKR